MAGPRHARGAQLVYTVEQRRRARTDDESTRKHGGQKHGKTYQRIHRVLKRMMPASLVPDEPLTVHGGFVPGVGSRHIVLDAEASGPIRGYHSSLAYGMCVFSVDIDQEHGCWLVQILEQRLFVMPQDDVLFDPDILQPPHGFWFKNQALLHRLRRKARAHGKTRAQVVQDMARFLDEVDRKYDYPQHWSDNSAFDWGMFDHDVGVHAHRKSSAHVAVDRETRPASSTSSCSDSDSDARVGSDTDAHACAYDYEYGRRPFCINTLAASMLTSKYVSTFEVRGSPSMLNQALKLFGEAPLVGITTDHNPMNDAVVLAFGLGRLLCRKQELDLRADRAEILCYRLESEPEVHSDTSDSEYGSGHKTA